MKLHFLGGVGTVTGVCFLLETGRRKILIDCGLFQGEAELEAKNQEPFVFSPQEIDAVIISHSHLDHIGRLPRLIKAGFNGKIFATPPTIDFTRLLLEDSIKILAEKAKKADAPPLFGSNEVEQVMRQFMPIDYYQPTKITTGLEFTFYEAGHILGSAIIELRINPSALLGAGNKESGKREKEMTIVFSGDLGNSSVPLLRPPDFLTEADYVLVESTYGDRNHETSETCREITENVIEDTVARFGVLLIPSFALERTQQLLYHLNDLVEHRRIPRLPVFIDSPLALQATEVYKKYPKYYNQQALFAIKSGDDIFKFPGLHFTLNSGESKKINAVPPPKVIIAGSGMSQGGRILYHERLYLSDPKNTLLLITYQAKGTLGRKIYDGAKVVEILDKKIEIKAKVQAISGYSAHADQRYLMKWLGRFKKTGYFGKTASGEGLKKIFVAQGEGNASAVLTGLIKDDLGVAAIVPKMGETEELE